MRSRVAAVAVLAAAFAGAAPATGQVPESLRAPLREIGVLETDDDYARVFELYAPLHAAAPTGGVVEARDVRYGPHERHRLDLFEPAPTPSTGGAPAAAPILVFVHGGAYVSGDTRIRPGVYGNVGTFFARHGLLAVNATYRLAPEHPWPAGAEDVGRLVAWLKENAAAHGGDPDRIFLMGHSAGASHVGAYAFDPRLHPPDGPGVAGVVLISGRYRLYPGDADAPALGSIRAYFGDDPGRYSSRSIVEHVPDSEMPALLVLAEWDAPDLALTGAEMFRALCERDGGHCPRFVQLADHDHISEILSFNTGDETLGREVLEFVAWRAAAARARSQRR